MKLLPNLADPPDEVVDGLWARYVPIERCGSPICRCAHDKHIAVFFASPDGLEHDHWFYGGASFGSELYDYVHEALVDEGAREGIRRFAVLFSVPWSLIDDHSDRTIEVQKQAALTCPFEVLDIPLDNLENFREAVNSSDPMVVAMLLAIAHNRAADTQ